MEKPAPAPLDDVIDHLSQEYEDLRAHMQRRRELLAEQEKLNNPEVNQHPK